MQSEIHFRQKTNFVTALLTFGFQLLYVRLHCKWHIPMKKLGFSDKAFFNRKKNVFSVNFSKVSIPFMILIWDDQENNVLKPWKSGSKSYFLAYIASAYLKGRAALCFCKKPDLTLPPPHHKQWNVASYHPLSCGLDFLLSNEVKTLTEVSCYFPIRII